MKSCSISLKAITFMPSDRFRSDGIVIWCTHLERKVHRPFEIDRCTASKLVGRLVQTDKSSVWVGPLDRPFNGLESLSVGIGADVLRHERACGGVRPPIPRAVHDLSRAKPLSAIAREDPRERPGATGPKGSGRRQAPHGQPILCDRARSGLARILARIRS